jgi:hypothetical protein
MKKHGAKLRVRDLVGLLVVGIFSHIIVRLRK